LSCGIYKITCKETGRCYIGQSKHVEVRWKDHHKRFPVDTFDYEIVAECLPIPESLDFWERHCIEVYEAKTNGFNITKGGNGAWGSKNPEETKRKKSEALKGRKRPPRSEEWCRNMSKGKTGKVIGPPSEETRRKISEVKKAKYQEKMNEQRN